MNRKISAFGLIELLFVIIIAIIIYFNFFNGQTSTKHPIEERARIKTQQQAADKKIQEIENLKNIRMNLEKNMIEEN